MRRGEIISASSISKFMKEFEIESKLKSRTLVIPGKVAVLKGEIEEKLPGWTVVVAPNEAAELVCPPPYRTKTTRPSPTPEASPSPTATPTPDPIAVFDGVVSGGEVTFASEESAVNAGTLDLKVSGFFTVETHSAANGVYLGGLQ